MGNFVPPVGHPVFLTERGYSYQSVALPVFVGPIATLDLSTNDLFEATMPESDVTLVLINPRIAAFRLTLHHAVGVFALTFPTGLFSGQPGPLAYTYSMAAGASKVTKFDMEFNGTIWTFTPLQASV